uniref:F-ATPase gamma subunit n=1 Tax=Populus trichocarpa TaxID=3694 RepID=A0A2K1YDU0_POPTR
MACSHLTMWVSSKASLSDTASLCFLSSLNPFQLPSSPAANNPSRPSSATPIHCGLWELRSRIDSVKNSQKITEAMKLVAAAKVRSCFLYNINEQLQTEDIDIPLTKVRPVKKVALVVVTGDRGLCGVFNNYILKKAEARIEELKIQILDALLPIYLNSRILKALQESLASELAARMIAMSNAIDNASELKKTLSVIYNR